jgi:hypothetical protein
LIEEAGREAFDRFIAENSEPLVISEFTAAAAAELVFAPDYCEPCPRPAGCRGLLAGREITPVCGGEDGRARSGEATSFGQGCCCSHFVLDNMSKG